MKSPVVVVSVLAILFGTTPAHAALAQGALRTRATPLPPPLRAAIDSIVTADSLPSLAISVVANGRILWEDAFGYADPQRHIRATPRTSYYLASVTKTLTASAAMALAQRHRLNIDEAVNRYLAPYPQLTTAGSWSGSSATVRHLLTHTSGLTTFAWTCYDDQPGCRVLRLDSLIARYGVLTFPPGEHFDYTNLGFAVLGEVVARVSGKSYATAMQTVLFGPVGMRDASIGVNPRRIRSTAVRVSKTRGQHLTAVSGSPGASAGYASAHDLGLFALMQLRHAHGAAQVLSPSTIDAMQRQSVSTGDGPSGYGLGWWIDPNRHGFRTAYAQGGTDDASASLLVMPQADVAIAVLTNTGSGVSTRISDLVLDKIVAGYAARRFRDSVNVEPRRPPGLASQSIPTRLIGDWTGALATYRGRVPLSLAVRADGIVRIRIADGQDTAMRGVRFAELPNGVPFLSGRAGGNLDVAEDVGPGPYDVYLELYAREGKLVGLATTYPSASAPFGARLSYAVMLTRQNIRPAPAR